MPHAVTQKYIQDNEAGCTNTALEAKLNKYLINFGKNESGNILHESVIT